MAFAETLANSSPKIFFIYLDMMKLYCGEAYFKLMVRADWKIAVIPFDELDAQVKAVYEEGGAVLAEPPHYPSETEQAAMTQVLKWGREMTSIEKYQCEFSFAPEYTNSSFVQGFKGNMTEWVNNFNRQQQKHDDAALIGILLFITTAVLFLVGGCVLYRKWKSSSQFSETEKGRFLARPSGRNARKGATYQQMAFDEGADQGGRAGLYGTL